MCIRDSLVGAGLACPVKALSAVVKDGEGWRALPLREIPRKQRMLGLRVADEVGILLAVVVLPFGEQIVTVAVAQLAKKEVGAVFNRAVAQRIHPDADGQAAKRVAVFRSRQHRPLIAQPPDVTEKSKHQQRANADGNADLCASKPHPEEFIRLARYSKVTGGRRDRTCTIGGHKSPPNIMV